MYVKITYNASTMYFSLRCPPPNITLLFWGSRNQIMVFVTTELFNPIQHTCSVFIVVVVGCCLVLFCLSNPLLFCSCDCRRRHGRVKSHLAVMVE